MKLLLFLVGALVLALLVLTGCSPPGSGPTTGPVQGTPSKDLRFVAGTGTTGYLLSIKSEAKRRETAVELSRVGTAITQFANQDLAKAQVKDLVGQLIASSKIDPALKPTAAFLAGSLIDRAADQQTLGVKNTDLEAVGLGITDATTYYTQ